MTMSNTLIHNPSVLHTFIGHSDVEHPLALQLGGNSAESLGEASYLACSFCPDWHSINLNCGCPSNKALSQGFGAELMLDAENTRQCVYSMVRKSSVPVTVKCRLGAIPGLDTHEQLVHFITSVKSAGCSHIIMHARDCMLKGLSPAQNRTVPPLRYDDVARLREEFPDMDFTLNGGVASLEQARQFLPHYYDMSHTETENPLQGIMVGRAAYANPWILADADSLLFHQPDMHHTRRQVLERYLTYCDALENDSSRYYNTTACIKPLHNFFAGAGNFQTQYKRKLDGLLKGKTIGPPSNRDLKKAGIQGEGRPGHAGGGSGGENDFHDADTTKIVTSSYIGDDTEDDSLELKAGTIRKVVEAAILDTIPASFLDEDPTTTRHLSDKEIRASHGEYIPVANSGFADSISCGGYDVTGAGTETTAYSVFQHMRNDCYEK